MLRLQFRHNFLSRPFRLSDARPFLPFRTKENVISGGRLDNERKFRRSADSRVSRVPLWIPTLSRQSIDRFSSFKNQFLPLLLQIQFYPLSLFIYIARTSRSKSSELKGGIDSKLTKQTSAWLASIEPISKTNTAVRGCSIQLQPPLSTHRNQRRRASPSSPFPAQQRGPPLFSEGKYFVLPSIHPRSTADGRQREKPKARLFGRKRKGESRDKRRQYDNH